MRQKLYSRMALRKGAGHTYRMGPSDGRSACAGAGLVIIMASTSDNATSVRCRQMRIPFNLPVLEREALGYRPHDILRQAAVDEGHPQALLALVFL